MIDPPLALALAGHRPAMGLPPTPRHEPKLGCVPKRKPEAGFIGAHFKTKTLEHAREYGGRPRKHPRCDPGVQLTEALTVIERIDTPHDARSDERIRAKCWCGRIVVGYAYNLRKSGRCGRRCTGKAATC